MDEKFKKFWAPIASVVGAVLLFFQLAQAFTGNRTLVTGLLIMVSLIAIGVGMWNYAFAQSVIQGIPRYSFHWLAKIALVFIFVSTILSGIYNLTILDVVSDCCGFVITETSTPAFTPSTTPAMTSTSLQPSQTYSATLLPAITQTATITLTSTPSAAPTPTIDPMIFRGLDVNCLSPNFWNVSYYAGESQLVDSRNCWDLTEWGVITENSSLRLIVKDTNLGVNITRRFHTKIKGDTEIKFTVRISQFTTNPNFDGMLMMGVGSSVTIQDSGFYIKYVVAGKDNKVYREVAPGLESYYEPRATYSIEDEQNIVIRIKGTQAKIVADGVLLRTASLLPDEHSVFWICYSLPANNGSLSAYVTNFSIEE